MKVKVQNLSKTKISRSWNTCSPSECSFHSLLIYMMTFRYKSVGNVYFHKVGLFAILHTILKVFTSEKLIGFFINKLHNLPLCGNQ